MTLGRDVPRRKVVLRGGVSGTWLSVKAAGAVKGWLAGGGLRGGSSCFPEARKRISAPKWSKNDQNLLETTQIASFAVNAGFVCVCVCSCVLSAPVWIFWGQNLHICT